MSNQDYVHERYIRGSLTVVCKLSLYRVGIK
jgi:hypothetical protein